jgi:uncharacterized protein (TIGR02466 family)
MIIEEYFKTPFWFEEKLDFLKSLTKTTDKYIKESKELLKKDFKNSNNFENFHRSKSLTTDTKFKDFHNYVGQKSLEFLDWQGFDMQQYTIFFSESWVQEFAKNERGNHFSHINHNQHVSGFYFLKANENNSYPTFHEPRTGARSTKLKLKKPKEITHGLDLIHFKVKPGVLLFFPGYMEYEFTVDHSEEPFRFIHFNLQAVPKEMAKVNIL